MYESPARGDNDFNSFALGDFAFATLPTFALGDTMPPSFALGDTDFPLGDTGLTASFERADDDSRLTSFDRGDTDFASLNSRASTMGSQVASPAVSWKSVASYIAVISSSSEGLLTAATSSSGRRGGRPRGDGTKCFIAAPDKPTAFCSAGEGACMLAITDTDIEDITGELDGNGAANNACEDCCDSNARNRSISSLNSRIMASLGSSLILGLFLMFFARLAYLRVDIVSSKL